MLNAPLPRPPCKVLALVDSPTLATGFARVAQNLFPHWTAAGVAVEVWAIGFDGTGYGAVPWPLYPAGGGGVWASPIYLERFLQLLATGGYTHCFILQDTFQFSPQFCQTLLHVCSQKQIRSLLYFPVDAPLEPAWVDIIGAVDVAVAYTGYGAAEAQKQLAARGMRVPLTVLPHGVDREIYQPHAARAEARQMWKIVLANGKEAVWLRPDDFCLLSVNANQRRKDPARPLEILAALIRRGVPARLVLHCRAKTPYGCDLEAVGRQLGLELWRDWVHSGDLFGVGDTTYMGRDARGQPLIGSSVSQLDMARMYNAADLCLSTSLGEGWGFSFTEALACGCPVALPQHTSCGELVTKLAAMDPAVSQHYAARQLCPLDASDTIVLGEVDSLSRVRQRVTLPQAADTLEQYYHSGWWRERRPLPRAAQEWLSWPRIAGEMLELLQGPIRQP